MKQAKSQKAKDRLIEQAYYKYSREADVTIDIMDIEKVFIIGREALTEGRSLDEAIKEAFVKFGKKSDEYKGSTESVI